MFNYNFIFQGMRIFVVCVVSRLVTLTLEPTASVEYLVKSSMMDVPWLSVFIVAAGDVLDNCVSINYPIYYKLYIT